jgi:hypothetical protein
MNLGDMKLMSECSHSYSFFSVGTHDTTLENKTSHLEHLRSRNAISVVISKITAVLAE